MFSFKYAGVLAVTIFSVLAQSQEVQTADKSAAIASLAGQISSCSVFQQRLRFPQLLGDGIDKPYMPLMRKERIKRIVFEFSAVWRDHKVTNIRLEQRLYFSAYDDSNSQITDLEHLKRIANSEMEKVVEDAIMQNAASASFFHGIHSGPKKGANGRALIELLDNAWLIPGHPPVFFPALKRKVLILTYFARRIPGTLAVSKAFLQRDRHPSRT